MSKPLPFARTAIASAVAAGFLCAPSHANTPVSGDFQVNNTTTSAQRRPALAVDADGDFVVVWDGNGTGDTAGIFARRFNAAGVAQGTEFRVNTTTNNTQDNASVAMDAAGNFVVAWVSFDGSGDGINAQRFNAAGAAQGPEFRVNTTTADFQRQPTVAMDADGDFVVAWRSDGQDSGSTYDYGIYAQRYNAAGAPQGTEFRVNSYTADQQELPSVAMDAAGNFVIAWQSEGQDGDQDGVYAQRYVAAGFTNGFEFRVNTTTLDDQGVPHVAVDASGDFVIGWQSYDTLGPSFEIFAQRYTAAGVAQGTEFKVNTYTTATQARAQIAKDALGGFVVTWESIAQDGSAQGTYGRRFDAAGAALSGEFRVNAYTSNNQADPAIGIDADGDFVVAWNSFGQDGSDLSIQARRYRGLAPLDLTLSQFDTPDPATTGGSLSYVLRVSNLQPPAGGSVSAVAAIDAAVGSATDVRIVSQPPAGASFLNASGSGWSCGIPSPLLTCRLATALPPAQHSDLTLNFTAPSSAASVQHSGQVLLAQLDPNLANNLDTETTQVQCAASVVQLGAASYTVAENAALMTVTATRSGGSCGTATVQFDTASSSALAGLDFTDVTGSLTWGDGELGDKTFDIPLLADTLDENDEKIAITLGNPVNTTLGTRARGSGVITDDDVAPRINFTSSQQNAAEPGALATATVQLSEISGRNVTVSLNRSGTATFNSDYFAPNGLTIPAGVRSVSFDVEVLDDLASEDAEFVTFTLSNAIGATLGSLKTHRVNIADDEEPASLPTVSFNKPTDSGTEAQARSVIATLSEASATTVTVPFTISGTATAGSDFTVNKTSPLSFAPGTLSITITVYGIDDAVAGEGSETAILTLGTPTNADLGAVTVFTRTITDND